MEVTPAICYDDRMSERPNPVAALAAVAYFIVTGVILIAVPWSSLWPGVFFGAPWLTELFANPILRGAVSGFGLVLIVGAVVEIRNAISRLT